MEDKISYLSTKFDQNTPLALKIYIFKNDLIWNISIVI